MAEADEVVVPPSQSPLLATLVVGVLGMVCSLLLIFGPGQVVIIVAAGLAGLGILAFGGAGSNLARREKGVSRPKTGLTGKESSEYILPSVDGVYPYIVQTGGTGEVVQCVAVHFSP